jgi:hypothetical protein
MIWVSSIVRCAASWAEADDEIAYAAALDFGGALNDRERLGCDPRFETGRAVRFVAHD